MEQIEPTTNTGDKQQERKEMTQIKRVTNRQKEIINQILADGLDAYYDQDVVNDRAIEFCVTEDDIIACVEYVENKFRFRVW